MVKRDGAFTRSERINEIRRFLIGCKSSVPYRKTIAMFQLKHGLTKEKIVEYLQIIEALEEIKIEERSDSIVILLNDGIKNAVSLA